MGVLIPITEETNRQGTNDPFISKLYGIPFINKIRENGAKSTIILDGKRYDEERIVSESKSTIDALVNSGYLDFMFNLTVKNVSGSLNDDYPYSISLTASQIVEVYEDSETPSDSIIRYRDDSKQEDTLYTVDEDLAAITALMPSIGGGGGNGIYGGSGIAPSATAVTLTDRIDIGAGIFSTADGYYQGGNKILYTNVGGSNTFVGESSGNGTMTGTGNLAMGNSSLASNTTGQTNIAFGFGSLFSNTIGSFNTVIGSGLFFNTDGSNNTGLGNGALFNTTGSRNVGVGQDAGRFETGSDKLYIHNGLGVTNLANSATNSLIYGIFDVTAANQRLTLNGNVGIGTPASSTTSGRFIVEGEGSTAGTINSLFRNLGGQPILRLRDDIKVLIGSPTTPTAGITLSSEGGVNSDDAYYIDNTKILGTNGGVALGVNALSNITTGSLNTAIGAGSLGGSSTAIRNFAGGYNCLSNLSGALQNHNVGVGFSSGTSLNSGQQNVFIGSGSAANINIGSGNVMLGYNTGSTILSTYNSSVAIGANALIDSSNQLVIGSTSSYIGEAYFGSGIERTTIVPTSLDMRITNITDGETDTAPNFDWVWNGSQGTGTGVGSDHVWKVAPAGSSGTTRNSLVEVLRLKGDGNINVANMQISDSGLVSGDLYMDTAANVLSNGDLVLAVKQ